MRRKPERRTTKKQAEVDAILAKIEALKVDIEAVNRKLAELNGPPPIPRPLTSRGLRGMVTK
jgi:hypothetical protein